MDAIRERRQRSIQKRVEVMGQKTLTVEIIDEHGNTIDAANALFEINPETREIRNIEPIKFREHNHDTWGQTTVTITSIRIGGEDGLPMPVWPELVLDPATNVTPHFAVGTIATVLG